MRKSQIKGQISTTLFGKSGQVACSTFFREKFRGILLNYLAGFVLVFTVVNGCGYSTKSLISRNINSIYIPVFENDTFRRGIEFDLTKALKDEVMSKTNLRIVNKDIADTVLYGTVKGFTERVITQDTADNIVESQVTLSVDIKLVDRRTGRALVDEKDVRQSAEFIVRRGETLESASEEGFVELAEIIVNLLGEKW